MLSMDPDPDLTIVLLGKTGVGKSASGNTILGQTAFESRLSFDSVTTEICEATGNVFGKQIRVIDTPGILDSNDVQEKIKTCCQDVLQSSKPCLFLVLLTVGRFSKEDLEAVKQVAETLGRKGLKKTYLLFTGGEALKKMTLDDFIFEKPEGELPDVVCRMNGAYHLFSNEDEDQDQVRELLLKSGHLTPPDAGESQDETRIVLLGRPGGGKSSSGNTILGSEIFTSDCDFDSVSTETVSGSARVGGRQVTVVDTPGLSDEALTPEQLYLEVMKTLVEASPGPHAFVIVVRLGRVSDADIKLFKILPKLFDGDASKYVMVLFTHGDQLKGRSIQDKIKPNTPVSDLVSMCGGRYCVFDNNKTRNSRQVSDLLTTIDEMVSANGGGPCSSDLFRMADTFIRELRNLPNQSHECIKRAWDKLKRFLLCYWCKICEWFTAIINSMGSRVPDVGSRVGQFVPLRMTTF